MFKKKLYHWVQLTGILNLGRFEFKYNSKIMIVMSVSLNRTEIKIQDLKTALPLSQAEGQLKISDYFS